MSTAPHAVPSTFAFHEVEPAVKATDGRVLNTLEQVHKLVQQQPRERFAVMGGALATESPPAVLKPLMLLGIMSGNEVRRRMLRCGWERSPGVRQQIRVLFVVGVPRPIDRFGDVVHVLALRRRRFEN